MKVVTEITQVKQCKATDCAYNRSKNCHAHAITIGASEKPTCGTYFKASKHTSSELTAGVGSCKVGSCFHNADFQCHAESIIVDKSGGSVLCTTFTRR